jgi:hypothetical protein
VLYLSQSGLFVKNRLVWRRRYRKTLQSYYSKLTGAVVAQARFSLLKDGRPNSEIRTLVVRAVHRFSLRKA